MDALAIVTAAVQLAQTFRLSARTIYQTFNDVRNAPKHATELRNEISSVLNLLHLLEDQVVSSTMERISATLKDDILECKSLLVEMNAKMEIVIAQKKEQMKWPFDVKETQEKLLKIGRYKETFNLALTVGLA